MAAPPAPNNNRGPSGAALFIGIRVIIAIVLIIAAIGKAITGDIDGAKGGIFLAGLVLFGPLILFRV